LPPCRLQQLSSGNVSSLPSACMSCEYVPPHHNDHNSHLGEIWRSWVVTFLKVHRQNIVTKLTVIKAIFPLPFLNLSNILGNLFSLGRPTWLRTEASPHQRWLNVTQIPVPGGWQHIYYSRWISLLHHGDTEGTEVPTLQGTTQTLTTTLW
jgi:hypothetical protein